MGLIKVASFSFTDNEYKHETAMREIYMKHNDKIPSHYMRSTGFGALAGAGAGIGLGLLTNNSSAIPIGVATGAMIGLVREGEKNERETMDSLRKSKNYKKYLYHLKHVDPDKSWYTK